MKEYEELEPIKKVENTEMSKILKHRKMTVLSLQLMKLIKYKIKKKKIYYKKMENLKNIFTVIIRFRCIYGAIAK